MLIQLNGPFGHLVMVPGLFDPFLFKFITADLYWFIYTVQFTEKKYTYSCQYIEHTQFKINSETINKAYKYKIYFFICYCVNKIKLLLQFTM